MTGRIFMKFDIDDWTKIALPDFLQLFISTNQTFKYGWWQDDDGIIHGPLRMSGDVIVFDDVIARDDVCS
jgi:hypothetical protein